MANRLINETSPYLLQHAQNPVDWHPWGDEALERARKEDKPILLSVGYSACHWCHVMERESFENQEIAQLMNENFVSIKVDREERPDIDSIYMAAVQAMTGQGGWPMTVFLTPEGKPFYGGTYFPPEDRGGLPAFPRVLQAMAHAYSDDRESVTTATAQLIERMERVSTVEHNREPLTLDILHEAFVDVAMQFDSVYGGLGTAPKFPQPMTYEFLLRQYIRNETPHALEIVELTLDRMALGGIYDQLGGGFHRYSTDTFWLVPHFEKMLYDNALLARLYLHAYQVTGKQLYRRVVEETLDYVAREMSSPEGGFYSAQDADSEGVEGKFFVWTPAEIADALGEEDAVKFNRYFDVTQQGNFEGGSILHPVLDADNAAKVLGMSEGELDDFLKRTRAKLLTVREERVHPGLDDKILTSWNGLMLRAFAEAAAVLAREDYAEIARSNAEFLCDNLRNEGRLLRTFKNGQARLNGYLEDYAFLIDGLIALHEVKFEERWLLEAADLGREMVDLFWNEDEERFYDTGSDHEELILRPRDIMDNAIPSGSSMGSDVLLRLALILGEPQLARVATAAFGSARDLITRYPTGAGQWLSALDFYLSSAKEIAIIGRVDDAATIDLLTEVHRNYLPNRVLIGLSDGSDAIASLPLLEGREMIDGRPTAFVCQGYVCQLPVNDPHELAKQLAR